MGRWHFGIEIMASIETVVQNADVEMADDSKPDSTAEVKDEPGAFNVIIFISSTSIIYFILLR